MWIHFDDGEIIEVANIHADPLKGFVMSGPDILNSIGREELIRIVGIWHTHPKGTTKPSKTDIDAIKCGAIHKNWFYFIATKDEVTQWNPYDYVEKDDSFGRVLQVDFTAKYLESKS